MSAGGSCRDWLSIFLPRRARRIAVDVETVLAWRQSMEVKRKHSAVRSLSDAYDTDRRSGPRGRGQGHRCVQALSNMRAARQAISMTPARTTVARRMGSPCRDTEFDFAPKHGLFRSPPTDLVSER